MTSETNPYEAPACETKQLDDLTNPVLRLLTYFTSSFAGLVAGSFASVQLGYFCNSSADYHDVVNDTFFAVITSPITMTMGLMICFADNGLFPGFVMLCGMALTLYGSWRHFRSRRLDYAWLVFIGMVFWSHNNYNIIAIMSD